MSLAQALLIPGLDGGFSASTFVGAWLASQRASSTGLITDERGGLGTDRPLQDGKAVTLNGTDQYGNAGNSSTLNPALASFTVSCWFKADTVTPFQVLFCKGNFDSNAEGYCTFIEAGKIYVRCNASNSSAEKASQNLTFLDTAGWHHIALVIDRETNTIKGYLDGTNTGWSDGGGGATGGSISGFGSIDSTSDFLIGSRGATGFFDGLAFDARVFNRALSQSEITRLAAKDLTVALDTVLHQKLDELNGFDSSGNRNDLTWVNSPTQYTGSDVPFSWQNSVGYSDGVNLVAYSESLDNVGWIKANATVTANAAIGPTGELIADKLVENTTDSNHQITSPDATIVSGPVTISAKLKAGERSWARLRIDGSTLQLRAWFNLAAGTVGAVDATGISSIQALGDGWYRCVLTEPNNVAAVSTANLQVFVQTANSQTTYLGDGASGIFIAGCQMESGLAATDYQPTEALPTAGVLIPRDESAPTLDVFGNALTYQGIAPSPGQLVQSNCLTLNGTDQSVPIGVDWVPAFGTPFEIETYAKFENMGASTRALVAFGNNGTAGQVFIFGSSTDSKVRLLWRDNAAAELLSGLSTATIPSVITKFKIVYNGASLLQLFINDVLDSNHTVTERGTTTFNTGHIGRLERSTITDYFQGQIAGLNINGERIFPCSEGPDSQYVTDTVSRTQYAITNPGSNWGVTQDVFHYNYRNGHSFYTKGANPDIRIPYGADGLPISSPTLPAGYSLSGHYPPKTGLNNCETRANFCGNPNAPRFHNLDVPGDGVLDAYQFDGDPGDVVVGRDTASEEGKFSLRKS